MKDNIEIGEEFEIISDIPLPPYVNWEVTNRCNMGCPYCFLGENPDGVLPDLSTEESKRLISRLALGGATLLNYAGGEPLLREDILELIRYGKSLGLKTVLSTNGILLTPEMIGTFDGTLDWISLPLDGPTPDVHDSVRGRYGHFRHILDKMEQVGETGINLKVNTMVCRKNVGYVPEIAELLDGFDVMKWKLFQFSARGKARGIKEEYSISDDEFLVSREELGTHNFDIIYSSNGLRDNAYFLIKPDGKVYVPSGEDYLYLGDIIRDDVESFRQPSVLYRGRNMRNAGISYDLSD